MLILSALRFQMHFLERLCCSCCGDEGSWYLHLEVPLILLLFLTVAEQMIAHVY